MYNEVKTTRLGLAERLRKLPLGYFGKRDLADLTETIMGDVKTIEHAYSHVLPELYGAYIVLGVAAVCLLAMDWRLAVAALWSAPVALALLFASRRFLAPLMKATRMKDVYKRQPLTRSLREVQGLPRAPPSRRSTRRAPRHPPPRTRWSRHSSSSQARRARGRERQRTGPRRSTPRSS